MTDTLTGPQFVPGDDSPAWLAAMGELDQKIEARLEYEEFIASKRAVSEPSGFKISDDQVNGQLFPFQRDVVRWCLGRGKAACFAATGLGKTAVQLEWGRHVSQHADGPVLVLAPLAVAPQTKREGEKFGIGVTVCRTMDDVRDGLNITNYELLNKFDTSRFSGVVCDESSVMKDWTAATTQALAAAFSKTPYKLCCTATPSPNDHTELGTHAEFLDVMTRMEMLSMYFCHDGGNTSEWRLKGHARKPFWRWLASWAISLRKPSDLGYSDEGYDLPKLHIIPHVVPVDHSVATDGLLFRSPDMSATGLHKEMRLTAADRAATVAELIKAEPNEQWLVICNTDYEADAIHAAIPGLVEVKGSDSIKSKEDRLLGFTTGNPKDLLSKASICGYGLNYQHCARLALASLSYSWEQLYQVIRRLWRYGQSREVFAHLVYAETEGPIYETIQRKEKQHDELETEMNEAMKEIQLAERRSVKRSRPTLAEERGDGWTMINGDCVSIVSGLPENTLHYTITSCPFSALYVYSDSEEDMGNSRDDAEFFKHFGFLVDGLLRATMPGRCVSVHCMDLPTTIERDGFTGLRDFSGEIIRAFTGRGFIYHSKATIWKDPLIAATRTKAIGLLHKQLVKDSARSRQGIPEYLITFRKPGINPEPISHLPSGFEHYIGTLPAPAQNRHADPQKNGFSHVIWQRYASPVWMDINPSDTLQSDSAREDADERHICPLALQVIDRGLEMWSNPGDLVLDPFMGIGSVGVQSLKAKRRTVGIELKESYFLQAIANLKIAEKTQHGLFSTAPTESADW